MRFRPAEGEGTGSVSPSVSDEMPFMAIFLLEILLEALMLPLPEAGVCGASVVVACFLGVVMAPLEFTVLPELRKLLRR